MLLDMFNKRITKNERCSEIKQGTKGKINTEMRNGAEAPVSFSKWNPKKHKMFLPLENLILTHENSHSNFPWAHCQENTKEHPHRHKADSWQKKKKKN